MAASRSRGSAILGGMRSADFLADAVGRFDAAVARAVACLDRLDGDELSASPSPGEWSTGQIVRHLILANGPYLESLESALDASASGDDEIRHSWFGRFMLRAMAPGKRFPAPKNLHPPGGPYGAEEVGRWKEQNETFRRLAGRAHGANLVRTRFRNPFLGIVRMNAADAFAILAAHTEYHVRQIEARHASC